MPDLPEPCQVAHCIDDIVRRFSFGLVDDESAVKRRRLRLAWHRFELSQNLRIAHRQADRVDETNRLAIAASPDSRACVASGLPCASAALVSAGGRSTKRRTQAQSRV